VPLFLSIWHIGVRWLNPSCCMILLTSGCLSCWQYCCRACCRGRRFAGGSVGQHWCFVCGPDILTFTTAVVYAAPAAAACEWCLKPWFHVQLLHATVLGSGRGYRCQSVCVCVMSLQKCPLTINYCYSTISFVAFSCNLRYKYVNTSTTSRDSTKRCHWLQHFLYDEYFRTRLKACSYYMQELQRVACNNCTRNRGIIHSVKWRQCNLWSQYDLCEFTWWITRIKLNQLV